MRAIYNHSQIIHLLYDLAAKGTHAIPFLNLCSAGVTYIVITCVCEGYIPYTHSVEAPEHTQILLERETILHTKEDGDNTLGFIVSCLFRRGSKGNLSPILVQKIVGMRQHLQSASCSGIRFQSVGGVDCKKLCIHPTLNQTGNIYMTIRQASAKVISI